MMERKSTAASFCSAGKYLSERRAMIHPQRNIPFFVLFYGVKGTLFIADGGREYALSPNEYLVLAANREHVGFKASEPGLSYYWCHFYLTEGYRLSVDEEGREWLAFGEGDRFRFPMLGEVQSAAGMHLLFQQLLDAFGRAGVHTDLICNSLLDIILAELCAACTVAEEGVTPSRVCENIVEWIRLNATQLHGVEEIAAHFGYNAAYLTTMIKKRTGRSLIEHLNHSRIAHAQALLRASSLTIREIAAECGFPDEKYFFRVFRVYCNMTPGAFRNLYPRQPTNDR